MIEKKAGVVQSSQEQVDVGYLVLEEERNGMVMGWRLNGH